MPVRNAALKALASFLLAVELKAERQPFQELVPSMLQTIADALVANEEQECRDALEVFVEIAESQPTFLKKHVQGCVTGFINIASNVGLEDATRHLALEFLLTVAEQVRVGVRVGVGVRVSVRARARARVRARLAAPWRSDSVLRLAQPSPGPSP